MNKPMKQGSAQLPDQSLYCLTNGFDAAGTVDDPETVGKFFCTAQIFVTHPVEESGFFPFELVG